MKIWFLLFSFTLYTFILNAQTLITPVDVVNFQSGTTNAFSNTIYKETLNNLYYIGLSSGRLKLLQDSIKTNATLTGNGFNGSTLGIAQQGATANQVLKWNGTTWMPANEKNTVVTSIVSTTNANFTLDESNYTVILNANTNITLPAANLNIGRIYIIKKTANGNSIISNFINTSGAASVTISRGVLQLQSDGTNWQQIN
jgi:hypothetical protein